MYLFVGIFLLRQKIWIASVETIRSLRLRLEARKKTTKNLFKKLVADIYWRFMLISNSNVKSSNWSTPDTWNVGTAHLDSLFSETILILGNSFSSIDQSSIFMKIEICSSLHAKSHDHIICSKLDLKIWLILLQGSSKCLKWA